MEVDKQPVSAPNSSALAQKAQAQDPDEQIKSVLAQFISSIEGLSTCFPVTKNAIFGVFQESSKEFTTFVKNKAIDIKEPDRSQPGKMKLTFTVNDQDEAEVNRLSRRLLRVSRASMLVPRSLFVSLVSAYDQFLGELIKTLLLLRPEILGGLDRAIKFSDLSQFDSIESARHFIVEKEVETVLRGSHAEHISWMESKFSITLTKDLPVWSEFIEITERRNLFVHAGGVVSGQYISVCKEHKANTADAQKGQQLSVTTEYFDRAYEVLYEMGVKLAHVLWRKLFPTSLRGADQNLLAITYTLISEERYSLATTLLDFAIDTLKKKSSEDFRLRFVFNRAQAYKWSGDEAKARAQVDKEDLSASKPEFKLAAAAILDDCSGAVELVKQMGPQSEIDINDLREWPLFKKLRELPEFASAVEEVYKEPLIKKDVDATVTALIPEEKPADPESDA